jgi:hypothetical protein
MLYLSCLSKIGSYVIPFSILTISKIGLSGHMKLVFLLSNNKYSFFFLVPVVVCKPLKFEAEEEVEGLLDEDFPGELEGLAEEGEDSAEEGEDLAEEGEGLAEEDKENEEEDFDGD